MKIAVLGAGAMGSMLGAYLQLGGADVTLLVRRKELADKFANPGIVMRSYTGADGEKSETAPIPMKASVGCEGLEKQDAVLIMVKGCDTKAALEGAASIIGDDTKIITLQNGIGNTDIIGETVKQENIYYGCVNMSAIMSAPGVLDTGLFGDVNVAFGSVVKGDEQKKFGDELANIFNASGIKAAYSEDIDTEVW